MKKNFLQDVIPANHKRSIRDVPLPSHRKEKITSIIPEIKRVQLQNNVTPPEVNAFEKKESIFDPQQLQNSQTNTYDSYETPTPVQENIQPKTPYTMPQDTYSNNPKKKKQMNKIFKRATVGVLMGAVLFIGFFISQTKAQVSIYPKKDTYEINTVLPVDASSILTKTQLSETQTLAVEATSEQQVESKASGKIVITNLDTTEPQTLIKNTRFETPEGLVYRIQNQVSVPGYTTEAGKTVPGTLEVEVYADQSGEQYNIGKTKFTIPGFKGTDQFSKITAESVTEMSDGYVGIKKVVSESEQEEAEAKLQAQLDEVLSQKQMISEEYVVVADGSTIQYSPLKNEVSGNTITFSLTGTVEAYSSNIQNLSDFIGRNTIAEATESDSFELNFNDLKLGMEEKTIIIKGSTQIKWLTDIVKLKNEIAGKKKSEIATVVNSYNSFSKTDINLKPFWKTKFPTDTEKIEVIIKE